MSPFGFFLVVGSLFSLVLYGVGYYLWSVPEQHAAEELGAETPYAPKMMGCHPKLRPQLFPKRAAAMS